MPFAQSQYQLCVFDKACAGRAAPGTRHVRVKATAAMSQNKEELFATPVRTQSSFVACYFCLHEHGIEKSRLL